MKTNKNKGFSLVEVLVVAIAIVLIGSLGYAYYMRSTQPSADTVAQQDASQEVTPEEVTSVESSSDIDKATEEIDQLNFDDTSDDASLNSSMSDL